MAVVLSFSCQGSFDFGIDRLPESEQGPEVIDPTDLDPSTESPSNNGSVPNEDPLCTPDRVYFNQVVNLTLVENCAACHSANGTASDTNFVLFPFGGQSDFLEQNYDVASEFASQTDPAFASESLLLLKSRNIIPHEGGEVFVTGSPKDDVLAEFVARTQQPTDCPDAVAQDFFEGVTHITPYQQIRRATLLLNGRFPTDAEIAQVQQNPSAVADVIDQVMAEPAFLEFVERGWHDVLPIRGFDGAPFRLDRERFPDRTYFTELENPPPDREAAEYGVEFAPVKLISHIVANDKPFTEIVTADYEMVNPFSAKSYTVFSQIDWVDPTDSNEWRATKFTVDDRYKPAGLLGTPMMWMKYTSTDTNLNRLRARIIYRFFLDTDILEIAANAADAEKASEYENPTKDFSQCSICHQIIDPVASVMKGINDRGFHRPAPDWNNFYDPGFEGTPLPENRPDAMKWLGEQIIKDPRFASAMAAHALHMLTGKVRLTPPKDPSSTDFVPRFEAYEQQQRELVRIGNLFIANDYSFKVLIREWLLSPFLTANALATASMEPDSVRLHDIGMVTINTPEDLSRKIEAIFGEDWNDGDRSYLGRGDYNKGRLYELFDGIDYVTDGKRVKTPSAIVAAVTKVAAEPIACETVNRDFNLMPSERRLFPTITHETIDEAEIRSTLVHLHERFWGDVVPNSHPDIDASYELWRDVRVEGAAGVANGTYSQNPGACGSGGEPDPTYAKRAWQTVPFYLLSDYKFFYQ